MQNNKPPPLRFLSERTTEKVCGIDKKLEGFSHVSQRNIISKLEEFNKFRRDVEFLGRLRIFVERNFRFKKFDESL